MLCSCHECTHENVGVYYSTLCANVLCFFSRFHLIQCGGVCALLAGCFLSLRVLFSFFALHRNATDYEIGLSQMRFSAIRPAKALTTATPSFDILFELLSSVDKWLRIALSLIWNWYSVWKWFRTRDSETWRNMKVKDGRWEFKSALTTFTLMSNAMLCSRRPTNHLLAWLPSAVAISRTMSSCVKDNYHKWRWNIEDALLLFFHKIP